MKESGYYPDGAEFDPAAPWNQEPELGLYRVTISVEVPAEDEDEAEELALSNFSTEDYIASIIKTDLIEIL